MGLLVTSLHLRNFRNFQDVFIEFDPHLTILKGFNAVGKTNCIEALQLSLSGSSFRHPTSHELIGHGLEQAFIDVILEDKNRYHHISTSITPGKRRYILNEKPSRAKDIIGLLPNVLFTPDHLKMVKDSARHRRDALDSLGIQLSKNFIQIKNDFERSLSHRNALLKEGIYKGDLFTSWTESFVSSGTYLLLYRISLFKRLVKNLKEIYETFAPIESLTVGYRFSWSDDYLLIDDAVSFNKEDLSHVFFENLKTASLDEMQRKTSVLGPHRDEILFLINGEDARLYGSQGQQRSIVLAWKMAEIVVVEEVLGYKPLLLLDDVMSELDATRRESMLSLMHHGVQTVVTTTNMSYFSKEILDVSKVVDINGLS